MTIQTVLGPIDDSDLGFTLSHEHVYISQGRDDLHYPWLFDFEATRAESVRQLTEAKRAGIDAMIELSTPDLGRDVRFMADVARASGMHVVAATGIWLDVPRSFRSRDPDAIADIFVREIETGIEDTGIRAGVIKVANEADVITPEAELVLRGAARASRRTGCPISTHHAAPLRTGLRQVEIFAQEGASMDRVCIGHSGNTFDRDYLEELLRAGVYLSLDGYPGNPPRPTWEQRNEMVRALVERGWAGRLMLGHDHYLAPFARDGSPPPYASDPRGYRFVSEVAIPGLLADGLDQATIDLMTREAPRAFLARP